jgi:hypothetical protein
MPYSVSKAHEDSRCSNDDARRLSTDHDEYQRRAHCIWPVHLDDPPWTNSILTTSLRPNREQSYIRYYYYYYCHLTRAVRHPSLIILFAKVTCPFGTVVLGRILSGAPAPPMSPRPSYDPMM